MRDCTVATVCIPGGSSPSAQACASQEVAHPLQRVGEITLSSANKFDDYGVNAPLNIWATCVTHYSACSYIAGWRGAHLAYTDRHSDRRSSCSDRRSSCSDRRSSCKVNGARAV